MGIIDRIRGRNRVDDTEETREDALLEEEARQRIKDDEREARIEKKKNQLRNKDTEEDSSDEPKEARGKGSGLFNINIPTIELKSSSHTVSLIIIAIVLLIFSSWYWNFMKLAMFIITFAVFLIFISYGLVTGLKTNDSTKIVVSVALLIWFFDMFPVEWIPVIGNSLQNALGPPWAGFEIPLINGIWDLRWWAIFTSGFVFALFYINMIFDIINKDHISFLLGFAIILISNQLISKYFPDMFSAHLSINIPGGLLRVIVIILIALIFIGIAYLAYRFDKKAGAQIPTFFTRLVLIFFFSFFWVNDGWMHNFRAWVHMIFILAFGFSYIQKRESKEFTYILIMLLLVVDFFGYGWLYSTSYLWTKFIPILVIFVVWYCYAKTESAYALTTFIFIVTLILILSLQAWSYQGSDGGATLDYTPKTGRPDMAAFFDTIFSQIKTSINVGISTATGGYSDQFFGNVENNQYEPLGVYFDRIRVAQPKFYDNEPVTIWGTIKSRTLSDPANVKFICARWEGSNRILTGPLDTLYPSLPFTVYTSEEKDVECTFSQGRGTNLPIGTSKITLNAQYNFETNAYQKVYFMDKDRYRSMIRENLNPLKEFGITDKTPVAIYTNGPVKIATDMPQTDSSYLLTVTDAEDFKPSFGIALENRNKITDKDGKAVGEWEGKIKQIRELILLLPKGVEVATTDDKLMTEDGSNSDCGPVKFKPFTDKNCADSCDNNVGLPCQQASCRENAKDSSDCKDCESSLAKCQKECKSLFKNEETKTTDNGQDYTGYQLDTSLIKNDTNYKDFDRFKTFRCRLDIDPKVLDNTPITTRYFRIKARYDYYLDKTFNVVVELNPSKKADTTLPSYEGTPTTPEAAAEPGVAVTKTAVRTNIYINSKNANEVKYSPMVNRLAQENDVSYLLTKAIIEKESSWKPDAIRQEPKLNDASYGLMQILGGTAKGTNCKDDFNTNPESNVDCGIKVLKSKYNLFNQGACSSGLDCEHPFHSRNYCASRQCMGRCTNSKCEYEFTGGTSTSRYYGGWQAALRAYNGWGATGNNNYVEDVLKTYDALNKQAASSGSVYSPPDSTKEVSASITTPGIPVSDIYFGQLNSGQRLSVAVDRIILHHTADSAAQTTFNTLKTRGLSVHYIIDRDGAIYYIVDESLNAWHAEDWNSRSIGIEIVNLGTKDMQFTDAQYASISSLINDIASRRSSIKIDNEHVLGHFQASTEGKWDPSPNFDWARIGLSGHKTSTAPPGQGY
ncbi:MAG: N-acetylmuramoyl-L-alanine amidase [Nanoarchaeota archaeon]